MKSGRYVYFTLYRLSASSYRRGLVDCDCTPSRDTHIQAALTHLTLPSITSLNFIPEILTVFSTSISPPSRALRIIHAFFMATSPELIPGFMTHLRVISIAAGMSLWDAFDFIRNQPLTDQAGLREGVWSWALGSPQIPTGALPPGMDRSQGMGVQKDILKQLLHLPLEQVESDHLAEFLAHPPRPPHPTPPISAKALDVLHDLVVLRMIHRGQYTQSIALDKALSGRSAGGSANGAGEAAGEEGRQRRRELIREFIEVLPPVQRRALALAPPPPSHTAISGDLRVNEEDLYGPGTDEDVDMGASTHSAPTTLDAQPAAGPSVSAPPSLALNRASAYADLGAASSPFSAPAAAPTHTTPRVQTASHTQLARTVSMSSPFGGPPQFRIASQHSSAGTPSRNVSGVSVSGHSVAGTPGPEGRAVSRLPSGSPFVLPPGAKVDAPKPAPVKGHVRQQSAGRAGVRVGSGEKRVGRHVSIVVPGEVQAEGDKDKKGDDAKDAKEGKDGNDAKDGNGQAGGSDGKEEDGTDVDETPQRRDNGESKDKNDFAEQNESAPKDKGKGKEKASTDMPPPPVPQPPPTSVRRSSRRAGSATPSVTQGEDDNDVSPTPTPSKPPRAASSTTGRGMTRTSTRARLGEDGDADQGTPAKKLRASKSVANLASASRSQTGKSGASGGAENPVETRTRTRSTPAKRSATHTDLAGVAAAGSTRRTTRTRRDNAGGGGAEGEDVLGELPSSSTQPTRRTTRRSASVLSATSAEDEEERAGREVSPAVSVASSTRSTRSRTGAGQREGSATPRAKRK